MAAVVLWFALCAPLHLATRALTGRSGWPRRFLSGAAWLIGVRTRVRGRPAIAHSLLLPNHLSWLDILVMADATGCAFVSKDDLGHGFVHWLADQNHTVYVRRSHVKGARDQAIALARALERDRPVAVFPEGTTGPGGTLLPFRSTLLEAASYAARDVEVRPVAIDYGAAEPDVVWHEAPVTDSLRRVLRRRGTLPVTVTLLDPLDRSLGRKAMTAEARAAIAGALGFTDAEPSPIGAAR